MKIIHTVIARQSALSIEPSFTTVLQHLRYSKSTVNKWTETAVKSGGNVQRYLCIECTYNGTEKQYQKCKKRVESYGAEIKKTNLEKVKGEERWIKSFLQE